jgi:2-C-methyl-D-erythritol 4-phosphate cytidylyltransferase
MVRVLTSGQRLEPSVVKRLDLILLAAGRGTRAIEPVAKQFLDVGGKLMLIHALSKFEGLPFVGTKYVTVHPDDMTFVQDLFLQHQITNFELVCGGKTRQESVRLALEHVRTDRVITHNAAVPFVTREQIRNVVRENYPCVTTVTPVGYSLCRGQDFAEEMVHPDKLQVINTPQTFHTKEFRECHRKAYQENQEVRTDCELMLGNGYQVKFVQGDPENFKITTPLDVVLAKSLAAAIKAEQDHG